MSGVALTHGLSLAHPQAFAYASLPCRTTATVALGTPVVRSTCVAIESTRLWRTGSGDVTVCALSDIAVESMRARITRARFILLLRGAVGRTDILIKQLVTALPGTRTQLRIA